LTGVRALIVVVPIWAYISYFMGTLAYESQQEARLVPPHELWFYVAIWGAIIAAAIAAIVGLCRLFAAWSRYLEQNG
jgi:hypothetical protein